eukprot:tig00020553_g10656.t1
MKSQISPRSPKGIGIASQSSPSLSPSPDMWAASTPFVPAQKLRIPVQSPRDENAAAMPSAEPLKICLPSSDASDMVEESWERLADPPANEQGPPAEEFSAVESPALPFEGDEVPPTPEEVEFMKRLGWSEEPTELDLTPITEEERLEFERLRAALALEKSPSA